MSFDPSTIDREELRTMLDEAAKEEEVLYTALGRKAFIAEASAPGVFTAEAEAIRAVKAKAALYTAILTALEARQTVCPSCGALVPEGAGFCPACGQKNSENGEAAETPVCPACGKVLKAGAVFCNACGTRLS